MRRGTLRVSRWLAMPLIWALRVYQVLISPMLVQQCRFYPSCSAYAVTALSRHGVVKGTWLAACRLARCHPWNPGGVDHVPPIESARAGFDDADHPTCSRVMQPPDRTVTG